MKNGRSGKLRTLPDVGAPLPMYIKSTSPVPSIEKPNALPVVSNAVFIHDRSRANASPIFSDGSFFLSFISTLIWTFVGWVIWSAVTYFVGTSVFGGVADMGEMLRVIGFAYAPQILSIIPCIGGLVGAIWSLIAGFVAVRQGLDLDNTKAFLTIVIGFVVYIVGAVIVGLFIGGVGALFG